MPGKRGARKPSQHCAATHLNQMTFMTDRNREMPAIAIDERLMAGIVGSRGSQHCHLGKLQVTTRGGRESTEKRLS